MLKGEFYFIFCFAENFIIYAVNYFISHSDISLFKTHRTVPCVCKRPYNGFVSLPPCFGWGGISEFDCLSDDYVVIVFSVLFALRRVLLLRSDIRIKNNIPQRRAVACCRRGNQWIYDIENAYNEKEQLRFATISVQSPKEYDLKV